MNKADLIAAVAEGAGISKAAAGKALSDVLDAITGALSKGESVSLIGFGTFSVSARPARTGRNPSTGAPVKIAAKKVAKFKAGSKLAEAVN